MLRRFISLVFIFSLLTTALPSWAVTYHCGMDGERHSSCCCAKTAMCRGESDRPVDCGCCERQVDIRPSVEVISAPATQLDLPAPIRISAAIPAFLQPVFISPVQFKIAATESPPGRPLSFPPVFLLHQSILC